MRSAWLVICLVAVGCGKVDGGAPDSAPGTIDARVIDAPGLDAATCVTSPAGLQARWRGEMNADDETGVFDGTAAGGFGYTPGKHGQAFLFDGVDDTVSADSSDALYPPASFSLEAWIHTTARSEAVIDKYDCGPPGCSASYWTLNIDANGHPAFGFRESTSANITTVTGTLTPVDDGAWHHLVAVRDVPGAQQILYVDGVVSVSQAISGVDLDPISNADGNADPATIGCSRPSTAGPCAAFFTGAIDDVAYYSAALTAAQVAANYAAPDGFCP